MARTYKLTMAVALPAATDCDVRRIDVIRRKPMSVKSDICAAVTIAVRWEMSIEG